MRYCNGSWKHRILNFLEDNFFGKADPACESCLWLSGSVYRDICQWGYTETAGIDTVKAIVFLPILNFK